MGTAELSTGEIPPAELNRTYCINVYLQEGVMAIMDFLYSPIDGNKVGSNR